MLEVLGADLLLGVPLALYAAALVALQRWYKRSIRKIQDDYEANCARINQESEEEWAAIQERYFDA